MHVNAALVDIQNLSFYRSDRVIFDHINLSIPKGKITAIMGPSGSGKTTLLRLMGGLLKPQSGKVLIHEKDISQISHTQLLDFRQKMGLLFQSGALFTHLSVFDNVAFPLREHTQLSAALIKDIVLMKLEAVGLRGASQLMPSELSGGMARRVALARSIALDPELIMYDEPFTGQDPISMGILVKLIKRLNDILGLTSVIVSHDVPETVSIADYLYLIADGKIVAQGQPKEFAQVQNPYVKQFMQGLPDGAVPFHYPAATLAQDFLETAKC